VGRSARSRRRAGPSSLGFDFEDECVGDDAVCDCGGVGQVEVDGGARVQQFPHSPIGPCPWREFGELVVRARGQVPFDSGVAE